MISDLEYKLLLAFFALTLLFSSIRTSDFVILEYNRSVERAEQEKNRIANNTPKISFSSCFYYTRAYETIIPAQLFFLVPAFVCTFLRRTGYMIASLFGPVVLLYAYFEWLQDSYYAIVGSEAINFDNTGLMSYLLYNSIANDFLILFSVSILLVVKSALLVRFAATRLHAKLEADDWTPRPRS